MNYLWIWIVILSGFMSNKCIHSQEEQILWKEDGDSEIRDFEHHIFAPLTLLSAGQPTKQSTTHSHGVSSLAVDGGYNQNYFERSCTHTEANNQPSWWEIDLRSVNRLKLLKIWNRGDCCAERMFPLTVYVSIHGGKFRQVGVLPHRVNGESVHTILLNTFGRYVRLEVKAGSPLTLCEVEIWGIRRKEVKEPFFIPINLLSANKPTEQSTTHSHGVASLAVDGGYNQDYFGGSCTHTEANANPSWWQVDLGGLYELRSLNIWNRGDCCRERLFPLTVLVSTDGVTFTKLGEFTDPGIVHSIALGSRGRFVRLQVNAGAPVTLCEVEVWGRSDQGNIENFFFPLTLLSAGKPTKQSTTHSHGVSSLAVDGGFDRDYFKKTCTHTEAENTNPSWWQVDLGNVFELRLLKIWNRGDCCSERLFPLKVLLAVDEGSFAEAVELKEAPNASGIYAFSMNRVGRYVRLQVNAGSPVTLCEVQVWGKQLSD